MLLMQVDLKSFLASGAFFLGCEATEQAMISQVMNSRHSSFLTQENQETNTSMSPAWASWTIFLVARGHVLRC